MTATAFILLVLGAAAFLFRVLRGPSIPDRMVALDGLLSVIVIGIIEAAARQESGITLTTVMVVAVAAFVGTIAVARFVERRGG